MRVDVNRKLTLSEIHSSYASLILFTLPSNIPVRLIAKLLMLESNRIIQNFKVPLRSTKLLSNPFKLFARKLILPSSIEQNFVCLQRHHFI